uniref:Uncharacterized protein n=1 Tax=Anguilla anguilla TaxID=7936 RepID=A0A0E9PX95_ANGAN
MYQLKKYENIFKSICKFHKSSMRATVGSEEDRHSLVF